MIERRRFLKESALIGAAAMATGFEGPPALGAASQATSGTSKRPIRILMGGYGPATTGFSLALKRMGDRLQSKFGDQVEVKYVYNILDFGYRADDIIWLVESGVLTLGYQSSSYFTDRIPAVGVADLPFLFSDQARARAAMDGKLGAAMTSRIEADMDFRIVGYFENGFRHVSNRVKPIHSPADMKGLAIRVLPSKIQARTFELLGANPKVMDLTEALAAIKAGKLDAQENPFSNTVTYGVHNFHRFHTETNHFYLSRPIFVHRPSFDGWPKAIQEELRAAVRDAVAFQRDLHVKEEAEAAAAIKKNGGEIVELTAEQHKAFVSAVTPIYKEARSQFDRNLLALVDL
ncbi:MAG TPA: TRAP transporter substrate-binding protein [Vicinamibacterales bacterium]|nr:TRAP transporter substrate-binding protein [Vicinamibacterales bacterium]